MRVQIAIATAVTALLTVPAEAHLSGATGAAGPGAASVSGAAYGSYNNKLNKLQASCGYSTVVTNSQTGGPPRVVGSFAGAALATTTYAYFIDVRVRCFLSTSAGEFELDAFATNSTPTSSLAWDVQSVPGLLTVYSICVNAEAEWTFGYEDAAAVRECAYPGVTGRAGDTTVTVPLVPPTA